MRRTSKNNVRKFLALIAIVLALGVILQTQGDLTNPLQSTVMLISMSSGETDFAMAGERQASEENVDSTPITSNTETAEFAESNELAEMPVETTAVSTTDTLTMEMFTAELAAAGVDVDAVSATMSAEGRSLENLLSVVNSGRVSVEDLATRLKGESTENTETAEATHTETNSTSLFDIHWEDFGSVLFNLWFILVVTIIVIVLARPAGWLTNRLRQTTSALS